MSLNRSEVKSFIDGFMSKADVINELDNAICSGDWLDEDWEEEFENEHEAYLEQGRGEAEEQIRNQFTNAIGEKFFGLKENRSEWILTHSEEWKWIENYLNKLHDCFENC